MSEEREDWAWRRWVRSRPWAHLLYRVLVALVGVAVVGLGLFLVPAPGPGWFLVLVGLVILASEFERARRLLDRVKARLDRWNAWIQAQPVWVRALVALLTAAFVAAVLWAFAKVSGVPGFLPDGWERWLHDHAGL